MARPTKYSKDTLEKAKYYLANYDTTEIGDVVPQIAGLARYLEVSRETLYAWSKEQGKEEFSDTLAAIENEQQRVLVNNGVAGVFNSNITKLMLHNHGFSDKKELSGPNGGPIPVENTWNLQPVACGSDSSQGS